MSNETTYRFVPITKEIIANLDMYTKYWVKHKDPDQEDCLIAGGVLMTFMDDSLKISSEILLPVEDKQVSKENVGEFKNGFSESDMCEFALDYFGRFMKDYAKNGAIDVLESVDFLERNIIKFKETNQHQIGKLRNKFFQHCTDKNPNSSCPSVNMAPHDLFEWFKPYLFSSQLIGGGKGEKKMNCKNCKGSNLKPDPVYRCLDCNCFHDKNGNQI